MAFGGRASVQRHHTVAEIEAAVWEEGGCTVAEARLLAALKSARDEIHVTIEASVDGLRIGALTLPLLSFWPTAVAPAAVQIFLASDLGVVHSRPVL